MKKAVNRAMAIFFLILTAGWSVNAGAAAEENRKKDWGGEQGDDFPILTDEQEESLDSAQALASEELLSAASWIDSFFDDRRFIVEENTSRATAELSLGYSKNDDFEAKPRLDIRLKLPRLSQRANIFIEAAEDKDFNVGSDPLADRLANNEGQNNELTAGIRYFFKQTDKYNISFDSGLSWNYLFAGVRYRVLNNFGKWDGRFTNRLRYYTDDGLENKTSYDLERRLFESWLFRATTGVVLSEEEEGIPHSQYFRLYHVLSAHQAISYETGVYFDTEPSYKMTDTKILIKYRQRFYRDWLILEISPRVTFPEDHDRDANPGIIVQLEASFGYKANEEGYRKIFR